MGTGSGWDPKCVPGNERTVGGKKKKKKKNPKTMEPREGDRWLCRDPWWLLD
jgi:hypothetical protein